MSTRKALSLLVTVHLLVGCDRGSPLSGEIMVTDSSGVTTYEAPPDVQPASWAVSEAPAMVIGDRDQPDGQPLYEIRSGRLFDDGSFVIANAGTHQVRFYSARGDLEQAVGREGPGPEEFGSISFLEVAADSVWLYDVNPRRISVISRGGTFGRVVRFDGMSFERPVGVIGVLGDGSVLVGHGDVPFTGEPGPRTHYERVHLVGPGGASTKLMGRFFESDTYWHAEGDALIDSGRPFGPEGLFFTHGEHWFYTAGRQYRVEQYDSNGELRAIYAYRSDPPRVREGDLDAFLDRMLEGYERPTAWELRLRRVPLPERIPAYADLRVDHVGNVWARPHGGPDPENCWHVYQRQPALLAETCLPDHFEVLDIGEDAVLGVLRDELDVEHVAVYRLLK